MKLSPQKNLNQTYAAFALALVLMVAGCKRADVQVYQVAKETPAAAPAPATPAMPAPSENSQPQLQFTVPPTWQQLAPSQMRVASFAVINAAGQSADVGVIPLPAGEDELALINMWRDQVQLPATTNAESQTVSVGGDSAKLFEVAGTVSAAGKNFPQRILVAELTRGPTSWFFKITGDEAFVNEQKDSFFQFLKSVSFVETASPNIAATPAPPVDGINPAVNSIWTIPAGWQSEPPSASVLFAQFLIQAADAKAEVNILVAAGEGGGLEMNVNRWRGQLGLPPAADLLTSSFDIMGGKAQLVDFTGTNAKTGQPARLIAAIVPQNGQTWFYKLMGDEKVVAAQKNDFIKFIQSAKYPDAH